MALSCLRGQQSNVIIRVISENELHVVIPLGRSLPMHATADGKVLLSTLSDEEIGQWLTPEPEKLTGNTLGLTALLKQMQAIRRDGVAMDIEEHSPGVSAISILLPTFMGPHAVTVIAPTSRFEVRKEEFRQALEKFREDFKQTQK
ncbi:hypothetical protein IB274_22240 [Pseudomonas sp. PDM18]|uniref:IclR-ED domain-containing protein n=1 Tax=Pseudomonas nitroreducens TaxID=46680 RepID=A0A5R9AFZ0_PSENT|nr:MULTISPECIES: IclR family transcriptional regulator C-terminal domain-containing protein [Pseudomonas]MBD9679445.1 hypothetical protein [Pseudomonas sp. PDM18]TLP77651.1 hypothetical protein FEA48_00195 [Pseudomonas nitroreducens]